MLIPLQKKEEEKNATARREAKEEHYDLDKHTRQANGGGDGNGNGRGSSAEKKEQRRRGRKLLEAINCDDDDDDHTDDVLSSPASTRQHRGLAGHYYYLYRYCEYWGIERRTLGLWRRPNKANLAYGDNDDRRRRRSAFGPHRQPHRWVRSSYANSNQPGRQHNQKHLSKSFRERGRNHKSISSYVSDNIFFQTSRNFPASILLVLSLLMVVVLTWNPSSPISIFDINKNHNPQIYIMVDLFDVFSASGGNTAMKAHQNLVNDVHHRHHHHRAAIYVSAFDVSPSIHIRIQPIRSRRHDRFYWIVTNPCTPFSKALVPGGSETTTTTAICTTGTHLNLYVDNNNQVDNSGVGDDDHDDDSNRFRPTPTASASVSMLSSSNSSNGSSLFGKYADYVYGRLLETGWLEPAPISSVVNSTTTNSSAPAEDQSLTEEDLKIENVATIPAKLYQSNIGEMRRRRRKNQRQYQEEKRSPTSQLTATSLFALNQPLSTIHDDPATQNISNEERNDEVDAAIDDKRGEESVRITVRALQAPSAGSNTSFSPLRYARIVLFETVRSQSPSLGSQSPLHDFEEEEQSSSNIGLQTLNVVVYPSYDHFVHRRHHTNTSRWNHPSSVAGAGAAPALVTDDSDATRLDGDGDAVEALPIWGVSLVATSQKFKMPCMATIDSQPGEFYSCSDVYSSRSLQYDQNWCDWYESRVNNNPSIPWGGRLRTPVMPFVSNGSPLLWTRFQNSTKDEAVHFMKTDLFQIMVEHLEIYLRHVSSGRNSTEEYKYTDSMRQRRKEIIDYQNAYMDFWRYNEPERSTLRSLYGEEWSEKLLQDVLFPSIPSSSNRDVDMNKFDDYSM